MSTEAMKLQEIMSQAQVFASAWSLVGGRFDGGNAMDEAEVAKNELHQMVAEALAAQPQQEPVAALQRVMTRLADLLDEDQFAEIEGIVARSGVAPPAQRKPLTDEQILEILCIRLMEDDDIEDWRDEINGARAIEAAHGIKENT